MPILHRLAIGESREGSGKMTREEAKGILEDTYSHWLRLQRENLLPNDECVKVAEAIDLAISALTEAENGCDGCLYEVSDGSLFPCNICRLNYGCKYEKDDSNNITESPNEVVEKNDEVIDHDREWIIGCIKHDGFIKTDRCDKANQIILDALEPAEPSEIPMFKESAEAYKEWLDEDMSCRSYFTSFGEGKAEASTLSPEMEDLISRAEAKQAIRDKFKDLIDRIEINEVLNEVPSVSAERVVRCKDCEYGEVLDEYESGSCSNSNGLIGYITKDDFCSYGVAKMKGGAE